MWGGSSIKYGLLDQELKFHDRGNVPTPWEGVEQYLGALEQIYRKYEGRVEGIAMSVPGMIDSSRGICITGGKSPVCRIASISKVIKRTVPGAGDSNE